MLNGIVTVVVAWLPWRSDVCEGSTRHIVAAPSVVNAPYMHIVERNVVARSRRKAHDAAGATTAPKRKVSENNVPYIGAFIMAAAVAMPALVARFDLNRTSRHAGSVKNVVDVCNVSDVTAVGGPRLNVDAQAPLPCSLIHNVPCVQHVFNAAANTASDRYAHPCSKFVVCNCNVLRWHTKILACFPNARQNGDVIIAAVNVVVLDKNILAKSTSMPSPLKPPQGI